MLWFNQTSKPIREIMDLNPCTDKIQINSGGLREAIICRILDFVLQFLPGLGEMAEIRFFGFFFWKNSNEIDGPKFEFWDEIWPKNEQKTNEICPKNWNKPKEKSMQQSLSKCTCMHHSAEYILSQKRYRYVLNMRLIGAFQIRVSIKKNKHKWHHNSPTTQVQINHHNRIVQQQ